MKFSWKNIKTVGQKITIVLILCIVVLVTVTGFLVFNSVTSFLGDIFLGNAETGINAFEQKLDLLKNEYAIKAEEDKKAINVSSSTSSTLSKFVENEYEFAFVTDTEGNILTSTSDVGITSVSDLSMFSLVKSNDTISDIQNLGNMSLSIVAASNVHGSGYLFIGKSLLDNAILDELKLYTGYDFTVFIDKTRVNTTLINDKNERQLGTEIDNKVYSLVEKNNKFNGMVQLFGKSFYTYYLKLLDASGNNIGIIFTGNNIQGIVTQTRGIFVIVMAVMVAIGAITIAISTFAIKRIVKKPLSKLTALMGRLKTGDFGIAKNEEIVSDIDSADEVGQLASDIQEFTRVTKASINEIINVVEDIANGDLTTQFHEEYLGDFEFIHTSLLGIQAQMSETFSEILQATNQVATGANQTAEGAQQLSQGAISQASTIQEVSASINEITEHIKNNSSNANEANELTTKVASYLEQSNAKMDEMLVAMDDVNKSSSEISKIIKTIDDIAFQTNILALNAAVEAARAGQAGKGFAVVADEVRNLASKSAEAAKNTTVLIEDTLSLVTKGTELSHDTADLLVNSVKYANDTTEIVNNIAIATNNQANSISQIQNSIEQVAAVVQSNSASAEESAATSEELSSQATVLNGLVNKFKIQ